MTYNIKNDRTTHTQAEQDLIESIDNLTKKENMPYFGTPPAYKTTTREQYETVAPTKTQRRYY